MTQLLNAMVAKLGNIDDPLPQESFEGVDEDEWVSDEMKRRIISLVFFSISILHF